MLAYLNPRHGDDSTAELNNRLKPWRTEEALIAAIKTMPEETRRQITGRCFSLSDPTLPPDVHIPPPGITLPKLSTEH